MNPAIAIRRRRTAVAFDPTSQALGLYQRGSYGGAPWAGTASAGGSGSRSLDIGAAPAVGAAQNGFTPASFNGSGHYLIGAGGFNWSAIASSTAWYMEVLFNMSSAAAAAALPYNNAQLLADNGGNLGLAVSTSGVKAYHTDGGGVKETAWVAASTGSYHIAQAWYDGVNINLSVDGGAAATIAAGSAASLNLITFRMGGNWNLTAFYAGLILDAKVAATAFDASTRSNFKAAINSRYALAL